MLWALTITVCLASGDDVECNEWRVEPFATKYQCQLRAKEVQRTLYEIEHQYLNLTCERGHYS